MRESENGKQAFRWGKVFMVLVSLSLGALLFYGLRRLALPGGIDGLGEALQIVAAPGALVLVILMPYMAVRSGGEWVEERQAKANLETEIAQMPNLSLLRASTSRSHPDELLRPTAQSGAMDPEQMLRAVVTTGAD
ncbi:MAG: hypothetical protein JWL77_3357 [Chthonomonadaceae bacterium]|nr:hypothetical protein [Chthonomonadaceae bacterium]